MRIWDMLLAPVRAVASAAGFYSPACGHWRQEVLDGLCLDCLNRRAQQRAWNEINKLFADLPFEQFGSLPAHPEAATSIPANPTKKEPV